MADRRKLATKDMIIIPLLNDVVLNCSRLSLFYSDYEPIPKRVYLRKSVFSVMP